MADERVIKVFHSARQDLEIVWNHGRHRSAPAVRHPGRRDGVRLRRLGLLRAARQRPRQGPRRQVLALHRLVAPAALRGAARLRALRRHPSDPVSTRRWRRSLQANGRHGWLDEEMAVLTSPETYRAEPENAWRRLSGRMRKPREIAVLMEVAAWREREAQTPRRAARTRAQGRRGDRPRGLGAAHASRRSGGCARSRPASSARSPRRTSWPPSSAALRATRRPCRCRSARRGGRRPGPSSSC